MKEYIDDMDKVINCLYLEVPEKIMNDITIKWAAVKEAFLNAPSPVIDLESKPVWVKASERLPEKPSKGYRIHVKYKGEPEILCFIDDKWYWLDGETFTRSTKYPVDNSSWFVIEWLDETAQQAPVEELQGLKDENSHLKLVVEELSEQLEEKRNRIRELLDRPM